MPDEHLSTPTGPHGTLRQLPPRSTSQSPARFHRLCDDLLSRLAPASALNALRSPTGPLKLCLDSASGAEVSFAKKTAFASKQIHDWHDELSDWPWPSEGGSAGFEMPPAKRRKLSSPGGTSQSPEDKLAEVAPQHDGSYVGSLPAADVIHYENRVEQISREMEQLDIEDIKTHVLHNHILPLSRPGTPFSDGGRSAASTSSFARMEDLTAVVTAITIQALPVLSRLSRLLNTWSVRLAVLRQASSLLTKIADAEVALRSGWSAIQLPPASLNKHDDAKTRLPYISRNDCNVMREVLQQKVARPGRDLDFMLDSLEGMADTLPDEWLDRMEALERNYVEWVAAAERRVQEGEWSNFSKQNELTRTSVEPQTPRPKIYVQMPSPTNSVPETSESEQLDSHEAPYNQSSVASEDTGAPPFVAVEPPAPVDDEVFTPGVIGIPMDEPSKDIPGTSSQASDQTEHAAHQHAIDSWDEIWSPRQIHDDTHYQRVMTGTATNQSPNVFSDAPRLMHPDIPFENYFHDGSEDDRPVESEDASPVLSEVDHNVLRHGPSETKHSQALLRPTLEDEFEPSILESVNEEDEEPELPPSCFRTRRDSQLSMASTVLLDPSSNSPNNYDNMPRREESADPELPRLMDPDEPFSSDALSPPSSPPLRLKPRSTSVTFEDIPETKLIPEDETDFELPKSPLEPTEIFDQDASFEWDSQLDSPNRMSTISTMSNMSEDDYLQRQIGEILESVPAKIKLKRAKVNLNPPDFQHPTRPKAKDSNRRSASSLSSRTTTPAFSRSGTPSFMLAPVRDNRPRSKSSQGTMEYILSPLSGESSIKLCVRRVGENGERLMVRVGGGWADLGEYLRNFAIHHARKSKGEGKVEVMNASSVTTGQIGSSPSSRPASALESPMTPLAIRKTRKSLGEEGSARFQPKTPLASNIQENDVPSPGLPVRSRSRAGTPSFTDWDDEDSSLGLAGPHAPKRAELSEEHRAWVKTMNDKVRVASGERLPVPSQDPQTPKVDPKKFGELGKVGGTKRLFRKN